MTKHVILDTSYGDVLVEQGIDDGVLECFIGDNYDDYVGDIDGTLYDNEDDLIEKVEELFY